MITSKHCAGYHEEYVYSIHHEIASIVQPAEPAEPAELIKHVARGVTPRIAMFFSQDGVTIMRPTTIQRRGYKQEAFESHFESKFERLKARWNPVEVGLESLDSSCFSP
jgi:hypothetical protein